MREQVTDRELARDPGIGQLELGDVFRDGIVEPELPSSTSMAIDAAVIALVVDPIAKRVCSLAGCDVPFCSTP